MSPLDSDAKRIARLLEPLGREVALKAAAVFWDKLPQIEQAALAADWALWARPNQRPPSGAWKTWGFLTGRGLGKTIAISNFVNGEVEAGRARTICLIAQDEQSAVDIQVEGPSGLIATSPPWFRPRWEASDLQLVWPNGARAYVRTPEVPGKVRGLDYQLGWATELQSWPAAHREEALENLFLSVRLGYGRVVWDSTPKKRHPLLKQLLAAAEEDPETNVIVRGSTYENRDNLADKYVERIERRIGGTQRGKEELLGQMLDESENATAKQAWIDAQRRSMPPTLARRVVSIDPAITNTRGSDTTGLVDCGLGHDGQGYVIEDASRKMDQGVWGEMALDWYVRKRCDLILAETNKGGSIIVHLLRVLAANRGLEVIVIGKDEQPPRHTQGKVFVREIFARGSKAERAEPLGTAYERGRISHVIGADLDKIETTLTTWEPDKPGEDSPGDLDALVHAMVELLRLNDNDPDPKVAFAGIAEAQKAIAAPTARQHVSLNKALYDARWRGGRGDRL